MDAFNTVLRPVLGLVLVILGAVLRFAKMPPSSRYGLGLPWTYADDDIWSAANRRLGELLLGWAAWTSIQAAAGLPFSWLGAVWAPLVIVGLASLSYPAHLYQQRYGTLRVERIRSGPEQPIPRRGGWIAVILREVLPLGLLLVPILLVRDMYPELPERVPVWWGPLDGPTDWRWRDQALALLRHRTMAAYLVLFLAQGGLLLFRWVRGSRRHLGEAMLTPTQWRFYLFRTGWVALLAGFNLGMALHAREGQGLGPCLLPGLTLFAVHAAWVRTALRETEYRPPPR